MEANLYIPHPSLQQFVHSLSTVNVILPKGVENVVTPHPATPLQCLLFYCNQPISMKRSAEENFEKQPHSVLIGSQYSCVNIKVHRQLTAIRVDFMPGGVYRMLGMPMHELFDGGFDAHYFFGAEIKSINEQLQNISNVEAGIKIVEEFLLKQTTKLKATTPFDDAMRLLLKHNGNLTVEKAASISCLGLKQFERKCKERIGMNPKLLSRIMRFSKAYRLHEASPQMSWTQIAYEAGYFDQMHMIRDFKSFAGVNPSVIEQQLLTTPIRMQKHLSY